MNILSLRKNLLIRILLFPLLFFPTGCVYLVVGGIGAVGGYVISPDTVEGITENNEEDVWDAVTEIVSIMGIVEEQYEEGGIVIAKISGAKVTISVMPLNSSSVKLSVKSRKAFLPKISIAQNVFVKIMSHLNE